MENSKSRDQLNGYVTVRSFGGMAIPIPVQNMFLRTYCAENSFTYVLPMGEHKYANCFMQLFATLEAVKHEGHIGMCSAFMLPVRKDLFAELRKRLLSKKATIHCLFERKRVRSDEELNRLREDIKLRFMTDAVDRDVRRIKKFLIDHIDSPTC